MDGWGRPDGLLDPESCALIEAALKSVDDPDGQDTPPEGRRTAGQRGADNLAEVFRQFLRGPDGAAPSTTADVVIDADTLAGGDDYRDDPAWATSKFVGGSVIGRSAVERLLCDSPVGRLIVNAKGEIVDLGRQERLFNRAQRRALARRDGCCAFPGCDRPAQWCDAHHLYYWEHGGPTDLANGALLCRRHHVLIHERGWTLERDPDTGIFCATSPTGAKHYNDPRIPRRRAPDPARC